MPRARKLRLLNAHFCESKVTLGANALTNAKVQVPFDRLIADQLGLNKQIYDAKVEDDATRVNGWNLDLDLLGATLKLRPKQATIRGVSIKDESIFDVLRVNAAVVKKHGDDEQLLMTFHFILQDEDAELNSLLYALNKDLFDLDIEPASKTAAKAAENQLNLLTKRSKKNEDAEAQNDTAKVEK